MIITILMIVAMALTVRVVVLVPSNTISNIWVAFIKHTLNPVRIFLGEVPIAYGKGMGDISLEPVEADGNASDEIILSLQNSDKEYEFSVSKGVNVLIYHTHTEEAYRQDGNDTYVASGTSRTKEADKSVVEIGSLLAEKMTKLGFTVIHDTTDHEPPKLSTAYSRSLETMEKIKKQYPNITLFIDVHRDAAGEALKDDVVTINNNRCARLMFVVGTGEQYNVKPNYDSNYRLASLITQKLESICSGFTRTVRVKTGRYNQHVSNMCLLVEVGHNAITLQDAKNSIPYLAQAIADIVTIE